MSAASAPSNRSVGEPLALVGMAAVAVLSLGPLILEPRPVDFVLPHASPFLQWGSKVLVLLAAVLTIAVCSLREGPGAGRRNLVLFLLAGLMTAWHWYAVDSRGPTERRPASIEAWQRRMYRDILSARRDIPPEELRIPHVYRPLPYGFVRGLERLTGDWRFSHLAYRWFFTFWLLWATFQFVASFHGSRLGWLGVAVVVILHPPSVMYSAGQLTDPMSHAFFVLALLWTVQGRWLLVLAAVALGVMSKETALILVPGYFAFHWRRGLPALLETALIATATVAAYVAVRWPVGWTPGMESPGGTTEWMVGTNLGIGPALFPGAAPGYQNYLQPLLFVGTFVPPIVWHWRRADRRLRALFLTVTPLLLLSSLCFSWLYESRNYVPLLPLLTALALPPPSAAGESNP